MILIMTIFLVIKLCQEPMTPGYVNVDETRQDKTMFYLESYTVLCISTLSIQFIQMYIDFIQIIYPNNLMYIELLTSSSSCMFVYSQAKHSTSISPF